MASTMRLDPEAVAGATFSAARRGYDPDEVRPFLRALSDEMVRLRRELDEARAQLAHRAPPMLDDASVAAALGEEAVRVLTTAREGASQIRTRAEEGAAELVRDANEDAARLRREADLDATHRRQLAASEAEAAVDAAKAEGREMVAEARAVRERMLDDLARRRERARAQFEQLRTSYERVLRTFESSAGALAVVTEDLRAIGPEVGANASTLESTGDTGPVALVHPTLVDSTVAAPSPRADEPIDVDVDVEPIDVDVEAGAVQAGVVQAEDDETEAAEVADRAMPADADADAVAVAAAPAAAPPVVQVVVPRRPLDVEVVTVADPATDAIDGVAAEVVVQSFVLGELDASMLHASPRSTADAPERDKTPHAEAIAPNDPTGAAEAEEPAAVTTTDPDEADVDTGADVASTTAPGPDAAPVAIEPAVEAAAQATGEEGSAPHKPLPSAGDLFARIRAAREQLTTEAHQAIVAATSTPTTVTPTPTRPTPTPTTATTPTPTPTPTPTTATANGAPADVIEPVGASDAAAARAAALLPIEEAMARRLKRVLADEQNEVLDRLRRAKTNPTVEELVGTPDAHAANYQRAVEGDAWAAIVAGGHSLCPAGASPDEALAGRTDLVAAVAAEVASELVDPFRDRLAGTLAAHEPAEAAELLRAVYRDWKTQRIDAVSEHVARFAFGRGAYGVLAPGTAVCWAVDPEGPGCPDGEDNALGGAVGAGAEFPTGHVCAPAYPGCRCLLLLAAPR